MMRDGLERGRAAAVAENAEVEAARDGIYMSKDAMRRAKKQKSESKLPPIE